VVEDKDTKIYLFGTVHVFAAGLKWRSAAVDRVIAEADELVMETPDASGEEMSFSDRLLDGMALAKPQPVLERVSPAMRPQLKRRSPRPRSRSNIMTRCRPGQWRCC
jgi:uncharacterized protein YbaP (TraB family)